MKRSALLFGVAALLLTAPAMAGGIGLTASTWDTDTAGDDEGAGVKVEIDMGGAFELEMRWTFFDVLGQASQNDLFEFEAVPIDFGIAYNFRQDEKVNPYLGVGGTYVTLKPNQGSADILNDPSRPRSQDEFGYYGELGFEVRATNKLSFFIEGLYRNIKGEIRGRDLNTDPNLDFQLDLAGASANVGLLYRW
ncbi:MAG: porin family protein [Acidobacteriota bacterium]|nr:porin family protein [Acidobacteriota bacterium]